ncbi:MAG: tail fiber protein [bacterium]|nr:tail fiber protein [bacterium]
MKKLIPISFTSLLFFVVLTVSSCEPGLNSNSSDQSSDEKFSFSRMYADIQNLNASQASLQASLKSSDSGLQAQIDALSTGLNELSSLTARISDLESEVASLTLAAAPVGSIQAWHKNLPGTPGIPAGWVECNGQIIADAESVYDGELVPDLNGEKLFLRGRSVSGEVEHDTTAVNGLKTVFDGSHAHSLPKASSDKSKCTETCEWIGNPKNKEVDEVCTTVCSGPTYTGVKITTGNTGGTYSSSSIDNHNHTITGDDETRPDNMSVVWIMRIK